MRAIFGSSGQAKEICLIIKRLLGDAFSLDCYVCADDDPSAGGNIQGIPVMAESDFFALSMDSEPEIYIGVGSPQLREKIAKKILAWNATTRFPSLIDPHASVFPVMGNVAIGQGVLVCAGVAITTDVVIGDFVHINQNCTVGHDVRIGNFTTLSPAVNISGNVTTGSRVFLGAGAIVIEGLHIADDARLGAGALVIRDIANAGVYVGVPARCIR